jgi:hypothetical protein
MATRVVKLTLGIYLLLSLFAGGPRANEHLEEAKQLYKHLKYVDVPARLERALAVEGNTKQQLCEIYELLGMAYVVLEDEKAARKAFKKLLSIDPDYRLSPSISPKILRFFSAVKKKYKPPPRVAFLGKPRLFTTPAKVARAEVQVDDPQSAVMRVDLWVKTKKLGRFTKRKMMQVGNNRYTSYLPIKRIDAGGTRVEFYIQARDRGRKVLAALGSRDRPRIVTLRLAPPIVETPPPPPPRRPDEDAGEPGQVSTPWYNQWWFWTAVGVVAVGLGVGIGVAAAGGEDIPIGSLGKLELD